MKRNISRRQFLGEASCKILGSSTVLSSILGLKLANNAAAASLQPGTDCKTVVCILLAGGSDSFNMLVRRDDGYSEYAASRTAMAIAKNELLPLNQEGEGDGNLYGLHPSCQALADMFNGTGSFAGNRRLAFVSNIGTLIQPTTLEQYDAGSVPVPKALFSHSDQINQWQTSVAQGMSQLTGWAGRMADVIHSELNTGATAMSVSLAGNNVFQIGNSTQQFAITQNGPLQPSGSPPGLGSETARKNLAIDSLMSEAYNNLVQDAFAQHVRQSHEAQASFGEHYNLVDDTNVNGVNVGALFGSSRLAQQLRAAAKTISVRQGLGLRRSTIFISRGGWDHHGELLVTHAGMLQELSDALAAFQLALEAYGVADDVITYTASDFGRKLQSNGRGTDHAWAGNQMVFGGPVQGGKICGQFPSLAINGPSDVGQGRLLPLTSVDEFFGETARWFGVSNADISYVLPNLSNFVDIASNPRPVGYLKPY